MSKLLQQMINLSNKLSVIHNKRSEEAMYFWGVLRHVAKIP